MNSIKLSLVVIFATICFTNTYAQKYRLAGKVFDENLAPLAGVTVTLSNVEDTTIRFYNSTNEKGSFLIKGLKSQSYRLKTYFVGYENYEKEVTLNNPVQNLDSIKLVVKKSQIEEVIVTHQVATVVQKGDTSEMNAAAFKVNKDATAEDLIKKMPSIAVDNSGVKAQGESIKQVLVDGKPFFGDDASVTLKNLPADVIDKIQIFNKLSDQAQLTGFDDGNSNKTLNIVTKKNSRNGTFGKLNAGYGYKDKYQAGGNINIFKGDRRISLLGMSNNINQQNFSSDDLSGVGGRGGGNFTVGQQNGITKTNALGINYSDQWGSKIKISGSYFFNNTKNNQERISTRTYRDTLETYNDSVTSGSTNFNHRANLRVEYVIDTMNTLIIVPRLNLQDNNSESNSYIFNKFPSDTVREVKNVKTADSKSYNLSNELNFRHKFLKKGRTISININTSASERNPNNSNILSSTKKYRNLFNDTIFIPNNQWIDNNSSSLSISGGVNYTEPLGQKGLIQLNYSNSYNNNFANKQTFLLPLRVRDTSLSNKYNSDYLTNKAGIGYRFQNEKLNGSINLNYQNADLSGTTTFPKEASVNKTFLSYLPSAMIRYNYSGKNNVMLNYRTSTNAPSISNLQNVLDNSNPLSLSIGNSDLKQEYNHRLMSRFSNANPEKSSNVFAFISWNLSMNPIINSFYKFNNRDTVIQNIAVARGVSFLTPVNSNTSSWSLNSLITYGFPFKLIKSNINLNTGINYSSDPGLTNDLLNLSKNLNITEGIVLSSNISETFDFTISYSTQYSIVDNSIETSLNNKYFSHNANIKFNIVIWNGIVLQNETSNLYNYGFESSANNQNYWLWNASIGKKLFRQKAELKLSVFDILEQNKAIGHNVNNQYIEDSRTNVLERFCMLTFTYNLKQFNKTDSENHQPFDRSGERSPNERQGRGDRQGGDRF
jgi:hypothetical protein